MPVFDFDFQRYVERRKGAREAAQREGAAYAYTGDARVLRTLDKLRPVTLAVESAAGLWRSRARAEILGPAVTASERKFARVHATAQRAAEALHVEPVAVFVSPQLAAGAYGFGTGEGDAPSIVVDNALVDALGDLELSALLGAELGHVQNGHVVYRTALYFLRGSSSVAAWIVKPATAALGSWQKRGDVTADRAGLIACRDIDAACTTIHKVGARLGGDPETLARRESALRAFAESAYYRGLTGAEGGYPPEVCDERVAEILAKGAK